MNANTSLQISYKINEPLNTDEIIAVFVSSGIRRPVDDAVRITKMFANANLVISAWVNNELVGVARAFTDFSYSCYLSDLAVKKEYQHMGIGRQLIRLTKEQAGAQSNLLLLSAPAAMEYYPKVGFAKADNAYLIKREA